MGPKINYEQYYLTFFDKLFDPDAPLQSKVVQIGPGKGIITRQLVKKYIVTCIEKDLRITAISGVKMQYTCLKKFNYTGFDALVGNIPYSYTHAVLSLILKYGFKHISIGLQKEVGYRCINPLTRIGYKFSKMYEIIGFRKLSRKCFKPVPPVDGFVFRAKLIRKFNFKKQLDEFFCYPRKTLQKICRKIPAIKIPVELLQKRIDELSYEELDMIMLQSRLLQ